MTAPTPHFSDAVASKARRYLDEGKVWRLSAIWYVVQGATADHRVTTDASRTGPTSYVVCSCEHGTKTPDRWPTCSHVAAVFLALRDGQYIPEWPTEGEVTRYG